MESTFGRSGNEETYSRSAVPDELLSKRKKKRKEKKGGKTRQERRERKERMERPRSENKVKTNERKAEKIY